MPVVTVVIENNLEELKKKTEGIGKTIKTAALPKPE